VQSARLPLQAAIVAALTAPDALGVPGAAVTATPRENAPLPLVVVGLDTEVHDPFTSDKDDTCATLTHTVRVYAASSTQAKTLAARITSALVAPLPVAGFAVVEATLDFAAPGYEAGPPEAFTDTVRVRYLIAPNP